MGIGTARSWRVTLRPVVYPFEVGSTYEGSGLMGSTLSLPKGQGWGAKVEVTSGFVSMFRQAQHSAGSTNFGMGRSLSLSKDFGWGEGEDDVPSTGRHSPRVGASPPGFLFSQE